MTRSFVSGLLLSIGAIAWADSPSEEYSCAYTVATPEGMFKVVPSEQLQVLSRASAKDKFTLPADAPADVTSINCYRSSSVPVAGDTAVLEAGYSLYIFAPFSSGKALLSLQLERGKFTLRLMKGRLSPAEQKAADQWVEAANASASKASPAET